MNRLGDIITALHDEIRDLQQALQNLERLEMTRQGRQARIPWMSNESVMKEALGRRVKDTRGRKSMGLEERKQVSARMKKYWAGRRQVGEAQG